MKDIFLRPHNKGLAIRRSLKMRALQRRERRLRERRHEPYVRHSKHGGNWTTA